MNKLVEKHSELKLPGQLDAFQMDVRQDESVTKGREFVQSKLPQGKGWQ
jgi:hypothetical protein